MKIERPPSPRQFCTGSRQAAVLQHCASIELEPGELVTFIGSHGEGYDVVRKEWGYYATPSLNGRLREHGLRAVLVRNAAGKLYLMLVEQGREVIFQEYLQQDQQQLVSWLDSDAEVARLCQRMSDGERR